MACLSFAYRIPDKRSSQFNDKTCAYQGILFEIWKNLMNNWNFYLNYTGWFIESLSRNENRLRLFSWTLLKDQCI